MNVIVKGADWPCVALGESETWMQTVTVAPPASVPDRTVGVAVELGPAMVPLQAPERALTSIAPDGALVLTVRAAGVVPVFFTLTCWEAISPGMSADHAVPLSA